MMNLFFGNKKRILCLSAMILIPLCFTGCMEAGASDWIGYTRTESTEEIPEASTEAPSAESVGEVEGGDKEVENSLPTYSIEEPPLPEEEDEDDEEAEIIEDSTEDEEDSSVSEDAIEEEDDDGNNHDVTKGSFDGSEWTAEADIGDNNEIKVSVSATKDAVKQEKVSSHKSASEKMGDDINDVRFSYYIKAEGGDKEAASSDVEDFEDVEKMSDEQLKALMAVSDDIGKLIAQFGITAYDFGHPADNDDNEVVLDLYCKNRIQFFMTLEFDEDNKDKLVSIDFSQEET